MRDDIKAELTKLYRDHIERSGATPAGAFRDMLTDLMHIAAANGLDFNERSTAAAEVYQEERQ